MTTTTKTKWMRYQCPSCWDHGRGKETLWNVEDDPLGIQKYQTMTECYWPKFVYEGRIGGFHRILCPVCGNDGHQIRGRGIRGSQGDGECGIDCEKATGSVCKCQCGGMNHGVVG